MLMLSMFLRKLGDGYDGYGHEKSLILATTQAQQQINGSSTNQDSLQNNLNFLLHSLK